MFIIDTNSMNNFFIGLISSFGIGGMIKAFWEIYKYLKKKPNFNAVNNGSIIKKGNSIINSDGNSVVGDRNIIVTQSSVSNIENLETRSEIQPSEIQPSDIEHAFAQSPLYSHHSVGDRFTKMLIEWKMEFGSIIVSKDFIDCAEITAITPNFPLYTIKGSISISKYPQIKNLTNFAPIIVRGILQNVEQRNAEITSLELIFPKTEN